MLYFLFSRNEWKDNGESESKGTSHGYFGSMDTKVWCGVHGLSLKTRLHSYFLLHLIDFVSNGRNSHTGSTISHILEGVWIQAAI